MRSRNDVNEMEVIDLLATLEVLRPHCVNPGGRRVFQIDEDDMSMIKKNLRLLARIEASGVRRAMFPSVPFRGPGQAVKAS